MRQQIIKMCFVRKKMLYGRCDASKQPEQFCRSPGLDPFASGERGRDTWGYGRTSGHRRGILAHGYACIFSSKFALPTSFNKDCGIICMTS